MGANSHGNSVPARVSFDILYMDLSRAQRTAAPDFRPGSVHVGDVLAYPVIEFAFEVGPFFPGTDVFTLQHLDVVREPADDEDIGKLGAQLVVGFRFLAFLGIAEEFRL